ncbi:methyltransferase-like protein 2 isoform X1 [Tanacetum coccineum]
MSPLSSLSRLSKTVNATLDINQNRIEYKRNRIQSQRRLLLLRKDSDKSVTTAISDIQLFLRANRICQSERIDYRKGQQRRLFVEYSLGEHADTHYLKPRIAAQILSLCVFIVNADFTALRGTQQERSLVTPRTIRSGVIRTLDNYLDELRLYEFSRFCRSKRMIREILNSKNAFRFILLELVLSSNEYRWEGVRSSTRCDAALPAYDELVVSTLEQVSTLASSSSNDRSKASAIAPVSKEVSNHGSSSTNDSSKARKRLELVDAFERHKVDIACFQETKWKGSSNIEGNGYKLWYSGSPTARNGVGVILKAYMKDKVVHVIRCSDRIITLTLVIDGETVNVINAYAPQVGLSKVEKKTFWDSLDKVMREFPTDKRLILGGGLNGHIGAATEGYAGVHGGFGYGVRNEEGRAILDFAIAHDLVVVNSHFKKRDHHLVTFQSGACSSQHNLLALDILFKSVQRMREGSALLRILWKNLIRDATKAFISRVAEGVFTRVEALVACDADSMWNALASIIKDAAKDALGVTIGTSKTHTARRESWWLCEEVQAIVAVKQTRFKELLSCREGNEDERLRVQERYKEAKRQAKKVIAQAKEMAYEDLYKKLDTKEGANDIFRIVKAQERRRRDLGDICFIKDEEGQTITDEEEIKKRWGEYFSSLFNAMERDTKRVWALADNHIPNATTRGSAKLK